MPIPAIAIPTVNAIIGKLTGGLGIKGSFKSTADFSSKEWLEFHASVVQLKNENGSAAYVSGRDDLLIGSAYRFIKGDYPQPDRDAKDKANREKMQAEAEKIQRLANLPINSGVTDSVTTISKGGSDKKEGSGLGNLFSNPLVLIAIAVLVVFLIMRR